MIGVYIILSLIFGAGVYLVMSGAMLPTIIQDFPLRIVITNIIFGVILILFSFALTLCAIHDKNTHYNDE